MAQLLASCIILSFFHKHVTSALISLSELVLWTRTNDSLLFRWLPVKKQQIPFFHRLQEELWVLMRKKVTCVCWLPVDLELHWKPADVDSSPFTYIKNKTQILLLYRMLQLILILPVTRNNVNIYSNGLKYCRTECICQLSFIVTIDPNSKRGVRLLI